MQLELHWQEYGSSYSLNCNDLDINNTIYVTVYPHHFLQPVVSDISLSSFHTKPVVVALLLPVLLIRNILRDTVTLARVPADYDCTCVHIVSCRDLTTRNLSAMQMKLQFKLFPLMILALNLFHRLYTPGLTYYDTSKRKAIPLTGRGGPYYSEMSMILRFLHSQCTDGCDLSALCAGRLLLSERFCGTPFF